VLAYTVLAVTLPAGLFTLVTTLPELSTTVTWGIPTENPPIELKDSDAMNIFHYLI
jgi:hypothetical protein